MGKQEFIKSRRARWQETEDMLKRIRRMGIRSLNEDELLRLGSLYREITSDLAKARAAEPFGDVMLYLNRLVADTHAVIYAGETRPWKSFWNFISADFPSLIRKHSKVVLVASLVFYIPAALGYYWMMHEPEWMHQLFPHISNMIQYMDSELEEGPALLASGNIRKEEMPGVSSFLMVHNIKISIYAFAGGFTLGLITIYSLIMNGVMLGGVAYIYFAKPVEYNIYFLAGVLPHGVIELTAICFSGAAGFLLAAALLMPGNLKRVHALQYHGLDAIRIMYGVMIMLVLAGFTEAFITPIRIDGMQDTVDWIKITFAVTLAILMIIYFMFAGRESETK